MDELCPKILAGCSKLMDEKGVAAGNVTQAMLETMIRRLIRQVREQTEAERERFVQQGAAVGTPNRRDE